MSIICSFARARGSFINAIQKYLLHNTNYVVDEEWGMTMARGRLSPEEVKTLKKNPYVSDVEETRIIYTNEFKFLFMQEYQNGKKPTEIFKDAGFDPKILGAKRIERAASRWKKTYASGGLGSYQNGTVRKHKNMDIHELEQNFQYEKYLEILKKQQKRIDFLEMENEFLRRQLS